MTQAYPLHWPEGWPRTAPNERETTSRFQVKEGQAIDDLFMELERLGAEDVVLSSNLTLSTFGRPYAKQVKQEDPGIAVYFALKGRPMVMARDRFTDWRDNIRSIGLAIKAIRDLERHGGGHMMERAFSGFMALPAPNDWRATLGLTSSDGLAEAEASYRQKSKERHPDVPGGSHEKMVELHGAIAQARKELK